MPAVLLPITLVTAGALAFINLWLAIRVGQVRRSEGVSIGDGGNERVVRRMRAQANFVEYAPLMLILIALIEFTAGTSTWLWVVAALFLLSRVLHGIGMDGWSPGRSVGTVITFLALLGLGGFSIWLALSTPRADHRLEVTLPMRG